MKSPPYREVVAVDNWATSEDDVPSRPEAVRRLVGLGLRRDPAS